MSHVPRVGTGSGIKTGASDYLGDKPLPCSAALALTSRCHQLFPFDCLCGAKISLLGSFRHDMYRKKYVSSQHKICRP